MGLLAVALFSLTLPATRAAVAFFPAMFVASGRAVIAGAFALAVLVALRSPLPDKRQWRQLCLISLGVVFGFPYFTTWAMQYVSATHGAVVLALLPLMTAVAGAMVAHERPSPAFWWPAVMGSGIAVVYALGQGDGGLHVTTHLADLALAAAMVSAAFGYALGAATSRSLGGLQTISWALVLSLPVNLLVALFTFPANIRDASTSALVGFGYVSVISMYLGFFPWYRALAIGGIARIGQLQLLQPFMTFAASALWLGEIIDLQTALFAIAIAITVGLGRRAPIHNDALARASDSSR